MSRTVEDYARAVPLGPVLEPAHLRRVVHVDIRDVTSRGPQVVATMQWNRYPHEVSHAVLPDDVAVQGGHVPNEEATLAEWAAEVVTDFAWGADLSLTSSRRTKNGRTIELTATEPVDPRYVGKHLLGSAAPSEWHEVARYANPVVPPLVVDRWRSEGTLVSWHYVTLQNTRVLPAYGHGASRWVSDGVASVDLISLHPDLPETFGVLTVADLVHRAAAEGAHTIMCTVDVPGLELLGFRRDGATMQIDNRFLDIDYDALSAFVLRTDTWVPPTRIRQDIMRANRATYCAG
ncbi:hypothetical protein [Aeromicrobium fastidiosum]|uniref:Uncharacterized protein n=1 Tax=Aeromicrobium fastidiosum TaxID=52699 RepID=A0A641AR94_9ACTN|nr:hypothetical protein [Aeromicrobium fastidiosum]KAA1378775.1 hypothetical protein ESP62_010630 [Aeromicrobium fastidiosum]MBP2392230.1 hypothetical protein [Aeromicrobium fastidiosum]